MAGDAVRHWRAGVGLAVGGLAGGLAAWMGQGPGLSIVVGANAGAFLFLALVGPLLLTADEDQVRERARRDDANIALIMGLLIAAMALSLGALVTALHRGHGAAEKGTPIGMVALAVLTLVQSWLVVQTAFAMHYAHLYFADVDGDGRSDRGVKFEGEQPQSYREFWYMSVCMGATFQVSDFSLTTTRFRNVVTVHALIAFAFNTMVISLGVGIVGNLLG